MPRRRVLNLANGSTLAGLWLARRARVPLRPGPHGLWLAPGYPRRFPAPAAGAVCVGDVVLLRRGSAPGTGSDVMDAQPRLFDHEARHAAQWARWGGLVGFLPAYLVAGAWSLVRAGDPHSANGFEVRAGLDDGGYRRAPLRSVPVGLAALARSAVSRPAGSRPAGSRPAGSRPAAPGPVVSRRAAGLRARSRGRARP